MSLLRRKFKVVQTIPGLDITLAREEDGQYWAKWLTEPDVRRFYPMETDEERKMSVERMQTYARLNCAFKAVMDGEVAGIGYVNVHPYKKIYHQAIFTIIVAQKWQGKGIGTKLLEFIERVAKETWHLEILHLEVYEGNPAIRLYRRMGYKEFGIQTHWIKETDGPYRGKIMMEKVL